MVCEEQGFDSGIRILEIIKILLNKNLTKSELISTLKKSSTVDNVYSLEAFIKYFNTIEFCGLKIKKLKNIYSLQNALYKSELSISEQNIFKKLAESIYLFYNEKPENIAKLAFNKIIKYFGEPINNLNIDEINKFNKQKKSFRKEIIDILQEMIKNEMLVKIEYKKTNDVISSCIAELKEITERNGIYYLTCKVPSIGRNKNINVDNIISVNEEHQKARNMEHSNTIIFEVYGRLIPLYKLRPSEKILTFNDDKMVISNMGEDKDLLFKRLIRYGENCKIILPEPVRVEFVNFTSQIIRNLEEEE
ncbi:hypothetical protein II906_06195 [bacterium]|nr:hypothetical protein [bacterium]